MPTLLTNRKMSRELALRIEGSVNGRRAAPGARVAPRSLSLMRLGLFAVIAVSACWMLLLWQRANHELERARADLLERVRREASSLTARDKTTLDGVRSWLRRSAGSYAGDFIAPELRKPEAFRATLARRSIYVRGAVESFRSVARSNESALHSAKDAFVLCLLEPPSTRSEKSLLARTRIAYAGGFRMRNATRHVHRLAAAVVGLPFLAPQWAARVLAAEDERSLQRLKTSFEQAPLRAAKQAAKARLLLFAMDEPGNKAGLTELDGERAHAVRVGLVDLDTGKLLLRLRRPVDPSWLSASVRAEYAKGIDSCALALDVREAVTGAVTMREN